VLRFRRRLIIAEDIIPLAGAVAPKGLLGTEYDHAGKIKPLMTQNNNMLATSNHLILYRTILELESSSNVLLLVACLNTGV
jgi:hypothetical protein